MRLAIVFAVLLSAGEAAAQSCPALTFRCPGSTTSSCGSACDGEVTFTRTATCNAGGQLTSCIVSASTGESCGCMGGACTLDVARCPCRDSCGGQCLDGLGEVTCCSGRVFMGRVTCCGTEFACAPELDCCQNGIPRCIERGGSCCEDGVRGCTAGSDCVSNVCCPRLSNEGAAFTRYDSSTGYCCGASGSGACACAVSCNGSCCPSGTSCCAHRGWCAPDSSGCPTCPASAPVMCADGTCAPSGATCCGGGFYCPTGLRCADCGAGRPCCGGGSAGTFDLAPATMTAVMPDGGGAVPSLPAAMSRGSADVTVRETIAPGVAQMPPSGCGGPPPAGGPALGTGFGCGCAGSGGALELLVIGLLLRAFGRARKV